MTLPLATSPAVPLEPPHEHRLLWPIGVAVLGVATLVVALWDLQNGQRSEYYAAVQLSMSQSWHNWFFGALDPAGTVSVDKIPGSFWIPALFVRLFGFSTWAVNAPNALALVGASLIAAFTARRVAGTFGGLLAGFLVAATPIFMAVSKSNQPESFFVLTIAATAWAGLHAMQKGSLKWLLLAGGFIALGFQTYMLEAWAVWPALGVAYLFVTQKKLWRRMVDVVIAGLTSAVLSLVWVIAVSFVPASARPYIGGTNTNSPWELVFGYNGLGRFSATQGLGDYQSFTPPFSGDPGVLRLFNTQVGGQIAWLIPAAIVAIVALVVMRVRTSVVVFLGGWFVTLGVMFSLVAGMHQFYTAALAVPMALLVAIAFGRAWAGRVLWPQLALLGVAVATAGVLTLRTSSYLPWAVPVQLVCGGGAVVLLVAAHQGWRIVPVTWVVLPVMAGLALTPAAWSVDTINHPNSMNPVAGDGSAVGMGGNGPGGAVPGGSFPGGGFDGVGGLPNSGGFGGNRPDGQGGDFPGFPGGYAPGGQGGPSAQTPPSGMDGRGGTMGGDQSVLNYVTANRDGAKYLLAVFGAQTAASYITESGGQEILPIGGFSGSDPVPTLEAFQAMVANGELHYVQTGGMGGGMGGGSSVPAQISTWVTSNCTAVSDMSGLYYCG